MKWFGNGHEPRYSIVVRWSEEDQKYIASLPEWGPGEDVEGDTYEKAFRNGMKALKELIELARQQEIPTPTPNLYQFNQYP